MELNINVETSRIESWNGEKEEALITVDLSQWWDQIVNHYTHLFMEISIMIPTQPDRTLWMDVERDVEVKKISEKRVMFTVYYSAIDDTTREPFGEAKIRGYSLYEKSR